MTAYAESLQLCYIKEMYELSVSLEKKDLKILIMIIIKDTLIRIS